MYLETRIANKCLWV